MVVNDAHKLGFAHIQRTGGGSMTRALMRLPGSRRVFPDHRMERPPGTEEYLWFLVVREPFAREWSHYCRRHGRGQRHWIRRAVQQMTFDQYVATHTADPARWEDCCQADWVEQIKPDVILRFEDLQKSGGRWQMAPPILERSVLPHVNASCPMLRDVYTPETAAMVREYAGRDFQMFGYDPEAQPC